MTDAATRCETKGCPNAPTEKVPDAKLPHVVYDFCASCATGFRALQNVPLIDAKDVPPLTFEPVAATEHYVRVDRRGYSGSIHAAKDGEGGLWTLCGRRVGVHWRVSVSAFDATQIDCKLCRRLLRG